MGHIIKEDIRQNFADCRESMGVCFLRGVSYREFITRHHPEAACAGEVVDTSGQVVGRHDGIAFYTIGQKRGFECSLQGVAIVAIDSQGNRLVVGPNSDLYHQRLEITDCNIVDQEEFISSAALDDLQCAWSCMQGLLNAEEGNSIAVSCVFDNEEVGSSTRQGADSSFLYDTDRKSVV